MNHDQRTASPEKKKHYLHHACQIACCGMAQDLPELYLDSDLIFCLVFLVLGEESWKNVMEISLEWIRDDDYTHGNNVV